MNDIGSGARAFSGSNRPNVDSCGMCLHELIEAQVARTPDAPAVRFEGRRLTYRQLDRWADEVAARLQRAGVRPDRCVGVCMERSLQLVVALFATLKAGGAYLPLDPGYPRERLAFIMSDAEIAALITTEHLRDTLGLHSAHVLLLDGDARPAAPATPAKTSVRPHHLAYNIYTSGSTGLPKGALNTHEGICNRILWMQQAYGIGASDRILQKTPFSFDVSVWEFFLPLLAGAELVVARPEGHKDPAYLAGLIEEAQITAVHFVPSMLRIFLQEPDLETRCRSLRHVFCSGEALTADLRDRFFQRFDAELHNLYGPTEAAVDVTAYTCRRDRAEGTVPIGFPVANTQIYIVNERGELAAPGEMGEIIIGGVQVARGYHNRPQLNAERFVPDTFGRPGGRLFRTGDLGRFREDGAIEFFGRRDHQIKIRGFRVELGEIEAVLAAHPAVQACAVTVFKRHDDEPVLVAHVVPDRTHARGAWQSLNPDGSRDGPDGGSAPSASEVVAEVRRHLAEKLPDYMIPASFRFHRELPLTPSGKIDRNALPGPSKRRPELAHAYVAPRTALERYLADLWSQVLDIEPVGIDDRFFELGGDSLRAARVINQLRSRLNEFIYITTMFEAPTVAQYSAMLERDYALAVARAFGGAASVEATRRKSGGVDEDDIAEMSRCVPSRPLSPAGADPDRNPPALFILAPPRSGTTLLRVMLAGHPGLFAAPELQLLGFETLKERREAYQGAHALWLEGGIRALMEVHQCSDEEAKRMMAELERQGLTTRAFFRYLQDAIGNRMLVDKSPSYAMDPNALARAERDFADPLYIHLVRHPYAMVTSFEGYHMEQVLYLGAHRFSPRQLGELVWLLSNRNILDFLANIPQRRQYAIRYEELVTRPHLVMQEMCARLGIPFDEGLLRPYDNLERKMTDGLKPDSTPMGDTHLFQYQSISPRAAARWRGVEHDNFLSEATWQLAELLGYDRPAPALAAGGAPAAGEMGA